MYQPARTLRQTRSPEPLSGRLKISDSLSKLSNESFFFSTHLSPGNGLCISWDPWDPHQSPKTTISTIRTNLFSWAALREGPAGTLGTPIRAPKQKYLPPKKAGFPWPLSKRGKTSNSLSKLPNEYLFSQPTSLLARGHVLASWDPWDSHQIPRSTFNTIHPRNKPIFLGRFQRGERPLILSQNSQMNHFFLSPPHSWWGVMYQPAGTQRTLIRDPKQLYFPPGTNHFSWAAFQEGKDHWLSLKIAKWTIFFTIHLTPGKKPFIGQLRPLGLGNFERKLLVFTLSLLSQGPRKTGLFWR